MADIVDLTGNSSDDMGDGDPEMITLISSDEEDAEDNQDGNDDGTEPQSTDHGTETHTEEDIIGGD